MPLLVRLLTIGWFLLLGPRVCAQELRVIKAHSKNITIRDGDDVLQGELMPRLRPDVYVYHKTWKAKPVVFATDTDSIAFMVEPGESYDFVVLTVSGDSCFQRITSVNPNKVEYRSLASQQNQNDTIPFVLGPNNAIHFKGKINGSPDLDLIFDTGASVCVLSEEGSKKAMIRDGFRNEISFSGITISGAPFVSIDYKGRLKADGVAGYNVFEDRIVEINYDQGILVVHRHPKEWKGYARTDAIWRGSAMNIPGFLKTGSKRIPALLLFDTGSKWALSLTKTLCVQQDLYDGLKIIGSRKGRTASGASIHNKTALLPGLELAGLSLSDVPADLEYATGEEGLAFNIVGNDVLKRFNVVIDYSNSLVYLQLNSLQNGAYLMPFQKLWILLALVLLLTAAGFFYWQRRKKRTPSRGN